MHCLLFFSQPAWFVWNDGSTESDILSHIPYNMAWFASKMAWLQIHLVQFQFFWTSFALIFLQHGTILIKGIEVFSKYINFLILY
jgi:hypothetical protein